MAFDVIVSLLVSVVAGIVGAFALVWLRNTVMKRRARENLRRLEKTSIEEKVTLKGGAALLEEQIKRLEKRKKIQSIINRVLELENGDTRMALIRLLIEMESGIRHAARKLDMEPEKVPLVILINTFKRSGQIPEEFELAFRSIWRTRNKAVHGLEVADEELKSSLELTAAFVLAFKENWPDFSTELPLSRKARRL
jgi:hypothetical protein